MRLIDTHTHLTDPAYEDDLEEVLLRARAAGVERIVVCGYDTPSSRAAVEMAEAHEQVFATVGVHPHDARDYDRQAEQILTELSGRPKVIAIGEIGLDFHYDFSPRAAQYAAFEAQVELACGLKMPIVVHSRKSNAEALQVLKDHAANIVGCVFHCFSGDARFAEDVLEMGFYIGVDGPITYKSSEELRDVVAMCPVDRLLVETDCPYLTPAPHRGKRNEPAYVRYVAQEAARVKEMSADELAEITTRSARELFGRGL